MMTLLLVFLIFWGTERVALFFGEQFAADYKARPEQFPAIVIYSTEDLHLDAESVALDPWAAMRAPTDISTPGFV